MVIHERLPQLHASWVIAVQNRDRGAADRCASDQNRPDPLEMALPTLAARIEQPHDLDRQRIAAAQVRTLLQIAPMATPAAVGGTVARPSFTPSTPSNT